MSKMRLLLVAFVMMTGSNIAFADSDKHDGGNNQGIDCSKLDNDKARRECRERKVEKKIDNDEGVDCSTLDNDKARRECRERKHD